MKLFRVIFRALLWAYLIRPAARRMMKWNR